MFFPNVFQKGKNELATPLCFMTGSLFLYRCYRYLTSMGPNEVFHFVTGIRVGWMRTFDYMQQVKMQTQSPVQVKTDINSVAKTLITMDEMFGHRLHAHFHSHPGNFSSPSGIDLDYQARIEAGGYNAIGGIFTRDGQIRFFSHNLPFIIHVYGKGVEQIDDTHFRFTTAGFFNRNAAAENAQDGGPGNRSAGEDQRVQPEHIQEAETEPHRCRWTG